ncbi:MAG TPA: MFS transporter [Solirubrobacteraceae bacterium]|jgi:EmrB/QacA subfamily drug resistance transporter|nr:MFS transporter [Solirubrobacteraceae bacterium]
MGTATSNETLPKDVRRWLALGVLLLAACMNLIDVTIVNIAIPTIRRALHAGSTELEWIVAAYSLAFALGLITGGRLGDIHGRRKVFVIGVAGFTAASTVCGITPNAEVLIAGRAAQGAFAALMVPQVLATIQVLFPGPERMKAFGLWGTTLGLATVGSPLLGAVLVQGNLLGLDWRPIFLVNLPIGVITLLGALAWVPQSRSERPLRLDLGGVGLVSVALLLLMYPLVQGQTLGWPTWTFVALASSIPAFGMFVAHQRRKAIHGSPLVPLALFRRPGFLGGTLLGLVFFSGIVGFSLVLVLTLQDGLDFSPIHSALTVVPFSIAIALASFVSIQLMPRLGRRLILIGVLEMLIGTAAAKITVDTAGSAINTWTLLPSMLISGLALGTIAPTLVSIALAEIPTDDAGAASGIVNSANQVGAAIGVALVGAIFFGQLPSNLPEHSAALYTKALGNTLWFNLGVFTLCLALVALLPKRRSAPAAQPAEMVQVSEPPLSPRPVAVTSPVVEESIG